MKKENGTGTDRRPDRRLKGYIEKKSKGTLYNAIGITISIFITLAMYFKKSLCLHGETLLIRDDTAKNSVHGFCCGMSGFEKKMFKDDNCNHADFFFIRFFHFI